MNTLIIIGIVIYVVSLIPNLVMTIMVYLSSPMRDDNPPVAFMIFLSVTPVLNTLVLGFFIYNVHGPSNKY